MYEKLVIANRGMGGIAKSSAIKAVYQLIKDKGHKVIEEVWQGDDIKAIFDIDGVNVGIESQGDPKSEMVPTMREFVEKDCTIMVTACRMKGDTYRMVTEYLSKENGYDIIWFGHYVYQVSRAEEIQKTFNKSYAEQVVKLISGRIEGGF